MKAFSLALAAVLLSTLQQASAQVEITASTTLHCTKFYGLDQYTCDMYEADSQERAECDLFASGQIVSSTKIICGYTDESQDPDTVLVKLDPEEPTPPPKKGAGEEAPTLPPKIGGLEEMLPPLQSGEGGPESATGAPAPRPPPERILPDVGTPEPPMKRGLYDLDALQRK